MIIRDTCLTCNDSITTADEDKEFAWFCKHNHNGKHWIRTEVVEK